jgi:hypothetical protein
MRILLAVLAFLVVAPGADGATITRSTETFDAQGGERVVVHTVTFAAAPGEPNGITVDATRGEVTVRDITMALTAGDGCAAADANTVRCATPRQGDVTRVEAVVRLGDRDDHAAITRHPGAPALLPTVEAGDGADAVSSPGIIEGGPGDDLLTGTDGDEGMSGGPGDDTLHGMGGDDDLIGDTEPQDGSVGGPEGNDVLDGGPGRDGVLYLARRIPVRIDLAAGTAGSAGESDTLVGIEDATGGAGADTITGTAGPNHLDGFGGRDVIRALGGDDVVERGTDANAGSGDDRVVFPRGAYTCGAGADAVAGPPRRAPVPRDCERVELDTPLTLGARPGVDRGVHLTFRTTCRCRYRGSVVITRGGAVLARGRVVVARAARGAAARVRAVIPLTRAGARAAVPGAEVTVAFRTRSLEVAPFRTRLR